MREGLRHLKNKFSDIALDEIHKSVKATDIGTRQIKSKQETLLKQLHSMREIDQSRYSMAERFGNSGLAQIRRMQESHSNYYHSNETLPIELYSQVKMQLQNQVEKYNEETKRLIDQIEAVNTQRGLDGSGEMAGVYGERVRVGPQHLLQLMQRQSEAFVDVASKVAEIHDRADMAREMYRRMFPDEDDPFIEQDRLESRERQDNERRAKENIQKERQKHSSSSSSSSSDTNKGTLTSSNKNPSVNPVPGLSTANISQFGTPSATVPSLSFPTTTTTTTPGANGIASTGFGGSFGGMQSSGVGIGSGDSGKKSRSKNKSESNLGAFNPTTTTGAFGNTTMGTMPSFNTGNTTGVTQTGGFGGVSAAPAGGLTTFQAGVTPTAGNFSFGVKK